MDPLHDARFKQRAELAYTPDVCRASALRCDRLSRLEYRLGRRPENALDSTEVGGQPTLLTSRYRMQDDIRRTVDRCSAATGNYLRDVLSVRLPRDSKGVDIGRCFHCRWLGWDPTGDWLSTRCIIDSRCSQMRFVHRSATKQHRRRLGPTIVRRIPPDSSSRPRARSWAPGG